MTLDQWHCAPGESIPAFMERAVRENDFVIAICSPRFKEKTDGRDGGVGYEGELMTALAFLGGPNRSKVIPVLRRGEWEEAAPTWLLGRYRIDLRGDPYSEPEYENLLRTLHGAREGAPPVGPRPGFEGEGGSRVSPTPTPTPSPTGSSPRTPPLRRFPPWVLYALVATVALLAALIAVYAAWHPPAETLASRSTPEKQPERSSPPRPAAILEGYVNDADTREPLADVRLKIQDWRNRDDSSPTATTDHAGQFRFGDLRPPDDPAQQVRLVATKPGYDISTTDPPLGMTAHPINQVETLGSPGGSPMRRSRWWLALPCLALAPGLAVAQAPGFELRGVVFSVEDGQADRKYLPNVLVTVVDFGTAGTTNDEGAFRVRLPAGVQPGQDLTIQEDHNDYYILLPVLSKFRVPSTPAQVVEIWMAPKGSKVLLGANLIEQFIAHTADDSAKRPKDPNAAPPDLSSYVAELARQSGRPAEEILGEITRWAAEARESDDPRKLGLAAFAEKKFRLAAENFGKAADAEKRRGVEGFRKSAANRTLEGDAEYNAQEFAKALRAYETAFDDLDVYHEGRIDLGLPAHSEYLSDLRVLTYKIAIQKVHLGKQVSGLDSQRYLGQAILEYRKLIAENPKSLNPQGWAMIQAGLGFALSSLGQRQPGEEGMRNLAGAVGAYREALGVFTREAGPLQWAMIQTGFGFALSALGERQPGEEGVRSLAGAVEVHRASLGILTLKALPQYWAASLHHLGRSLQLLVLREGFIQGLERIERLAATDELRNDPIAQITLRALATFAQVVSGRDAEARRGLADLVILVEQQPGDGWLVWHWSPLRSFLDDSKDHAVIARQDRLSKLLNALAPGRDMAAVLTDLKGLVEVFSMPVAQPKP